MALLARRSNSSIPDGAQPLDINAIQTQPVSHSISSIASAVLHGGIVMAGIVTTLLDPILPLLIGLEAKFPP
jgi:hypothetical protein